MEYFSLSQQLGEQSNINQEHPKKLPEFSHQITFNNTTPPQKRRRGRPPKCPTSSDDQPSPAAHLSAAVVKQGTPKASAPLMRISPLRGVKRRESNSSPPQRSKENPSPKGGLIMKLDDEIDRSPTKKQKKINSTTSSAASNSIHSLTLSSTTPKSKIMNPRNEFKTPNKVTMNTQENIHLLTSEGGLEKVINESVNPSLLLSSPMSSVKRGSGVNSQQNKLKSSAKKENQKSNTYLSSSPMTPNSYASSCFSSIIQSSPLYQGYYANQSSPNPLSSSPIKFQMKPIDLPDIKGQFREPPKAKLPKMEKVPKNPVNSPVLKPQATSNTPLNASSPSKNEYKLSFSIDEHGQAQIVKVKTETKKSIQNTNLPRPPFTRHESLMSIKQGSFNLPRTGSLSNINEVKESSISIGSVLSPNLSSEDYETFIQPSQMTSDPLVGDFSQTFDPTQNTDFMNDAGVHNQDEFEDESVTHDARNALIKMIRRSV
ncbi:Muscle M-line assembly protein unc-89 [Wickerhamomyces ciferrii]|uniref:Muscle M-line assembly protein unc-89 n=1 Tax=Wickerhamomyces ciferrii (strain ATCC 14091 / BCRC 22168 / CBS 111 / JCM 3599 / NBRC 0793 / NRRL Y-1031 F-60-10) TaxID=1206466 RepID=K0KPE6_WICCF|nr:Muscle M-line assembly protein unc-89 [Wickerhamomyces ciferrii]CCH43018.1 Muscle M-line assembly protein unc-89 [Wickerhamomyces ciferrii]